MNIVRNCTTCKHVMTANAKPCPACARSDRFSGWVQMAKAPVRQGVPA